MNKTTESDWNVIKLSNYQKQVQIQKDLEVWKLINTNAQLNLNFFGVLNLKGNLIQQ